MQTFTKRPFVRSGRTLRGRQSEARSKRLLRPADAEATAVARGLCCARVPQPGPAPPGKASLPRRGGTGPPKLGELPKASVGRTEGGFRSVRVHHVPHSGHLWSVWGWEREEGWMQRTRACLRAGSRRLYACKGRSAVVSRTRGCSGWFRCRNRLPAWVGPPARRLRAWATYVTSGASPGRTGGTGQGSRAALAETTRARGAAAPPRGWTEPREPGRPRLCADAGRALRNSRASRLVGCFPAFLPFLVMVVRGITRKQGSFFKPTLSPQLDDESLGSTLMALG